MTHRVRICKRTLKHGDWIYELRWTEDGKEFRKSLGSDSLEFAEDARAPIEAALLAGAGRRYPVRSSPSWQEFADQYLASMAERKRSPNSILASKGRLKAFQRSTEVHSLAEVTPEIAEIYFRRESIRRKPQGVLSDFARLRAAFAWAIKSGLMKDNPLKDIDAPRAVMTLPNPFEEDEITRLYEVMTDPGDRLLMTMLLLTGLRFNEALTLKWNQVSIAHRRLSVRIKGGRERAVPIADILAEMLEIHPRGEDDTLFPGGRSRKGGRRGGIISQRWVADRFRRYCDRAGITGPSMFNRFKYTSATTLLNIGYGLDEVGAFLGHTNRTTVTQRYAMFTTKRLRVLTDALNDWLAPLLRPFAVHAKYDHQ